MKQSLDTRTKLLTQNPVSLMFELSIPAILGMVVVGLYNFMDSVFVGQMVGSVQMGAISVSYPFTLINGGTAAMLGVGSASVLSRAIGKKDEATIGKIMGNLVAMVILLSAIITIVGMVFTRPILTLAGASGDFNLCRKIPAYCICRFSVCEFLSECQYGNQRRRPAEKGNADYWKRRSPEYYPGPHFHYAVKSGGERNRRSGICDGSFPDHTGVDYRMVL